MFFQARYVIAMAAGLHLLAISPVAAQRAPERVAPHSTARLLAGGVLGGGAGLAAGGLIGLVIGANHCLDEGNPDSCHAMEGVVYGGTAGMTLSIPLGVHLANGREGRLAPSLLASAVIAGAGALAIVQTDSDAVLVGAVISVPVLQLISSVLIERATTRR
ncbi:hypothetical protein BH23GEM9_BH23GEM9_25560 [soil metagenome]